MTPTTLHGAATRLPYDKAQDVLPKRVLSDRMEKFCVGVVEGKTHRDAYLDAYTAPNMKARTASVRANELTRDPRVLARIKELRDIKASSIALTLNQHLEDLRWLRDRAARLGNMSAAVAAEVARGKAAGVSEPDKLLVAHVHKLLPASVDDFV